MLWVTAFNDSPELCLSVHFLYLLIIILHCNGYCFTFEGEFREENFQKAMAVIREGGTDPGSQRGRKGGTKGTRQVILPIQFMICA